jgi:hypothetical protein
VRHGCNGKLAESFAVVEFGFLAGERDGQHGGLRLHASGGVGERGRWGMLHPIESGLCGGQHGQVFLAGAEKWVHYRGTEAQRKADEALCGSQSWLQAAFQAAASGWKGSLQARLPAPPKVPELRAEC